MGLAQRRQMLVACDGPSQAHELALPFKVPPCKQAQEEVVSRPASVKMKLLSIQRQSQHHILQFVYPEAVTRCLLCTFPIRPSTFKREPVAGAAAREPRS